MVAKFFWYTPVHWLQRIEVFGGAADRTYHDSLKNYSDPGESLFDSTEPLDLRSSRLVLTLEICIEILENSTAERPFLSGETSNCLPTLLRAKNRKSDMNFSKYSQQKRPGFQHSWHKPALPDTRLGGFNEPLTV
ncbi:hypothetical protein LENED_001173 [Lentinula edodes]|uniref:Uncharacterized protein n=1 Tax=Lentinula edodes TaxID=5353 RepID=A0A1Q3DXG0_LENED|nr:hypothetical protein LENED_001173 [Lentinula edodes]